MEERSYDVVVLGAGPAGEVAAGRLVSAGLSAALIEEHLVGGECTFYACMPSKGLLRPTSVLEAARRVPGAREAVSDGLEPDAALERRTEIVADWDDAGQVRWVDSVGVDLIRGHGRITGVRSLEVETEDGPVSLEAMRAVVVATGSSAAVPEVDGLGGTAFWDSRGATSAPAPPDRLLVVGGGAVGVEMAQAWHSLGTREVTIVERGDHLLSMEEPFAGTALQEAFEGMGMRVLTRSSLAAVRRDGPGAPVHATLGNGTEIDADELLISVGRRPRTTDIGLESVGLQPGAHIEVDDRMRAVNVEGDWLYAIGDVNGRALLTHIGKYQGRVVADVIAGRDVRAVADRTAIPRVVFTDPQVASVGLIERAARAAGIDVVVVDSDLDRTAGSVVTAPGTHGAARLVFDGARATIVGATFVGPEIGDMLHAATIAIAGEVPFAKLWHAVPSFPALSEVWLMLLEGYEHATR